MKKGITVTAIVCVVILLGAAIPRIKNPRNRIPHDIGSTRMRLSNLSTAIQVYEMEYSRRLYFMSSTELLEILEGRNEREIKFLSISEGERNEDDEIIDFWGNPVIAASHDQGYTLISAGRNEEFDGVEHDDDIIFHITTKAQPVAGQRR